MRYRLMASYADALYEAALGPAPDEVVLFAACPPPEELGFQPARGHWRKRLHVSDVECVWEARPVGSFRGVPCLILDDLGDRLHIAYLGHDGYEAERLGFWQVDRGVYELVTARDQVSDIREEHVPYPPGAPAPQLPPRLAEFRPPPAAGSPVTVGPPGAGPRPADVEIPPPPVTEPPLPVEAAALAAAAARTARQQAGPVQGRQNGARPGHPAAAGPPVPHRRRRGPAHRISTDRMFAELIAQAAIPPAAYAIGREVDGALCLVQTPEGYEVFIASGGSRQEARVFADEESAYFYLFGILAADAVRAGLLMPARAQPPRDDLP
jgi:hypothetical protein